MLPRCSACRSRNRCRRDWQRRCLHRNRLWQQIVQRHGLAPHSMEELIGASWQFADAVFGYGGSPADTVVSTVKARQFGFAECVDTEEMFVRQLTELQAAADIAAMTGGCSSATSVERMRVSQSPIRCSRSADVRDYPSAEFDDGSALIERYLHDVGARRSRPDVASPSPALLIDGRGKLTNGRVVCDERDIAATLGGKPSLVINDFTAVGHALPVLPPNALKTIGPELDGRGAKAALGTGHGARHGIRGARRWSLARAAVRRRPRKSGRHRSARSWRYSDS